VSVRGARPGDGSGIARVWLSAAAYYASLDPAHFSSPAMVRTAWFARGIQALPRAAAEPIQRHREVVHPDLRHDDLLTGCFTAAGAGCRGLPMTAKPCRYQRHGSRSPSVQETDFSSCRVRARSAERARGDSPVRGGRACHPPHGCRPGRQPDLGPGWRDQKLAARRPWQRVSVTLARAPSPVRCPRRPGRWSRSPGRRRSRG
jgi:hypothetical protein